MFTIKPVPQVQRTSNLSPSPAEWAQFNFGGCIRNQIKSWSSSHVGFPFATTFPLGIFPHLRTTKEINVSMGPLYKTARVRVCIILLFKKKSNPGSSAAQRTRCLTSPRSGIWNPNQWRILIIRALDKGCNKNKKRQKLILHMGNSKIIIHCNRCLRF